MGVFSVICLHLNDLNQSAVLVVAFFRKARSDLGALENMVPSRAAASHVSMPTCRMLIVCHQQETSIT